VKCLVNTGMILAALAVSAFGQGQQERRTTVAPLPGEDILNPCEYRLILPESNGPLQAVWTVFDRGPDHYRWYQDPRVRAFADAHRLALLMAMHCRSKEREDIMVEPAKGPGRALFAALDQFGGAVATAPVIAMGWSGAGALAARLAGYRPERYLAGIAYAPGQYDPLGMDTIELSQDAIRAPQLIIANGGDNVNGTERPYNYFKKYFDKGAPWTFVVQNRTPHCCLQNAQTLILDWLDGVLTTPRKSWKHGYITVGLSNVTDEWHRPVFNATSARVSERGGKELPAGWLPSSAFATDWLEFVRRPNPIAIWKP
jgi:hypothetical protein